MRSRQNMAELENSAAPLLMLEGRKRLASADSASTEVDANSQPRVKRRLTTDGSSNSCETTAVPTLASSVVECPHTEANTRWALANFSTWQKRRNERFPEDSDEHVPSELLKSTDPKLLTKWLSLYAAEARKQDGGVYPPKTIYLLLAGLLRHMRSLNPVCPNFLSSSNSEFTQLHHSLEDTFRELRVNEVMSETKTSEAFSKEEEDRLWSSGALSTETPKGLLRAVFFLNGRNFGLVGGDKHRQLKLSQLKRVAHPPRYVYTRCVPENHAQLLFSGKKKKSQTTICIDAVVERGNRCHVRVLDLYLQKLPPEAFENDVFYLQPVGYFVDPTKPWFTAKPVGLNSLGRMVKDICADAGIDGVKTNQSLRASGATNQAGASSVNTVHEPTSTTAMYEVSVQSTNNVVPAEPVFVQPLQGIAQANSSLPHVVLQPQPTANQQPVSVQHLQGIAQANSSLPHVVLQPQPTANQQPVSVQHLQGIAQANSSLPHVVLQPQPTANQQPVSVQHLQGIAQANSSLPHVVLRPQPTANQQPVSVQHLQDIAQTNTFQPHIHLQSPSTASQQPALLQVQGSDPQQVAPQNLTFNNCHVTIIMTPFQQQPESQ